MKEPLRNSERFKVALVTVMVEMGLLFLPALGVNVDPELLEMVALAIAGVVGMFIYGRSIRNVPNSHDRGGI